MPSSGPAKARKKASSLDLDGLLAYSARVLAARPQTISELRQKLQRRAAERQNVEEVIRRLQDNGYLNDQRFADSFATWRRDTEGHGKARVVRDLMARRVAPELAKKAAETAYSAADEIAMIQSFLGRKFRGKNLGLYLREEKHLAAAYRRLCSAGFSSGNTIQVLKRYAAEADVLENLPDDPAASGD